MRWFVDFRCSPASRSSFIKTLKTRISDKVTIHKNRIIFSDLDEAIRIRCNLGDSVVKAGAL